MSESDVNLELLAEPTVVVTDTKTIGGVVVVVTHTVPALVTDPASFFDVQGSMDWVDWNGDEWDAKIIGVGSASDIPEPWTLALMTIGFALLGFMAAWERKPNKTRLDS